MTWDFVRRVFFSVRVDLQDSIPQVTREMLSLLRDMANITIDVAI